MSGLNCLCCGKPLIEGKDSEVALKNQWHEKCSYAFFGTTVIPEINISKEELESLATETVSKGFTIAGVQKKLSLHLSKERECRLTLVGLPAGFILKPQTEEFENLPEMEQLVMHLAELSGIKTVPNALIKVNDQLAYITRRIDRIVEGENTRLKAMEDFCQLSQRLTEEKYKSSYERCAKVIKEFSSQAGLDVAELFYRLVFCFITGNSDMHLKNFSLIEKEPSTRSFELSAAYDLLPVNVVMPEDKEEFALTMNGKKANLKRDDFLIFARTCGLNEKAALKMIKKLVSLKEKYIQEIQKSFVPESGKAELVNLVETRVERLL